MKYLIALAALALIAACDSAAPAPVPVPPATEQPAPDCDQPGQRDEQGRPIPQC